MDRLPAKNETLAHKCSKPSSNSLGLAQPFWDLARLIADQCTRLFLNDDTDHDFFYENEYGLVPVTFWTQPGEAQKKEWLLRWAEILEKVNGKGFKAEMLTVYIGDEVVYPLLPESWDDSAVCAVGDFSRLKVEGQYCEVYYFDIYRLVEHCQRGSQATEAFIFRKSANGVFTETACSKDAKAGHGSTSSTTAKSTRACVPQSGAMQAGAALVNNPITAKHTGGVSMHVSWGGVLTDGSNGGQLLVQYGNHTLQGRPPTIWETAMAQPARIMILTGRTDPPLCDVTVMLQAALSAVGERVDFAQLAGMAATVCARMSHAQRKR